MKKSFIVLPVNQNSWSESTIAENIYRERFDTYQDAVDHASAIAATYGEMMILEIKSVIKLVAEVHDTVEAW